GGSLPAGADVPPGRPPLREGGNRRSAAVAGEGLRQGPASLLRNVGPGHGAAATARRLPHRPRFGRLLDGGRRDGRGPAGPVAAAGRPRPRGGKGPAPGHPASRGRTLDLRDGRTREESGRERRPQPARLVEALKPPTQALSSGERD